MEHGLIKAIDNKRGMGYIEDNKGRQIPMITQGREQELSEGVPVTFEIKQTRVGILAVNVVKETKQLAY